MDPARRASSWKLGVPLQAWQLLQKSFLNNALQDFSGFKVQPTSKIALWWPVAYICIPILWPCIQFLHAYCMQIPFYAHIKFHQYYQLFYYQFLCMLTLCVSQNHDSKRLCFTIQQKPKFYSLCMSTFGAQICTIHLQSDSPSISFPIYLVSRFIASSVPLFMLYILRAWNWIKFWW